MMRGNQLSGNIPPELGSLVNLRYLFLSANQLSGPLPHSLTNLALMWFYFDETALCEPADAAFQTWLAGITNLRRTGVVCSTAYFPLISRAGSPWPLILAR